MKNIPKLCDKDYNKLFKEFEDLASEFVPEWKFDKNGNDFGIALSKIFCEMQEDTIIRLNKSVYNIYLMFLKLIGVSPNPQRPSRGLISVSSSKSSMISFIKKGSKISSKGDVIFETAEDMFVMYNEIQSIFMTDKSRKKIVKVFDLEESKFEKFKVFDFQKFKNLQSRFLYLYDDKMFSSGCLDLNFKFENALSKKKEQIICDFFSKCKWQCYDNKQKSWVDASLVEKRDELFVNVKFDHEIEFSKILESESRFIRIVPLDYQEVDLTGVLYYATERVISPVSLFSSEDQITNTEIFPFKESYYIYDSFYIECGNVLQNSGSIISLFADINFKRIKSQFDQPQKNYKMIMSDMDFAESEPTDIKILSVSWEYWNGNAWTLLKSNDQFFSTDNSDRTVEFICPEDIEETSVGSRYGFFIRSRITKISNQFSLNSNYIVPILKDIKIKCFYKNYCKFENLIVNSDLELKSLSFSRDEPKLVSIFKKRSDDLPSIYIRLKEPISEGIMNLFFDIEEGEFRDKMLFKWQYWSNQSEFLGWEPLNVVDYTSNFSKSGIVKILGSNHFEKLNIFGQEGFFIRIVSFSDIETYNYFPVINDIKLNSVEVIQKDSRPYEYFSIKENEKNKVCSLSSKNIFEVEVWVNEASKMSLEEQNRMINENSNMVDVKKNDLGIIEQMWVKWSEVSSLSHPRERGYIVDFKKSQVIFGDGIHGKIPCEQLSDSIRIKYCTTEGAKGNIPSHSIGEFDEVFPSVVGVDNPNPMYNGLDGEDIDRAASRTFDMIKRGNRIVTAQGLENAILFQNRNLYKVKCFPHMNKYGQTSFGNLTIAVLPKIFSKNEFEIIKKEIETFIDENASFNLAKSKKIDIREVKYAEFYIKMKIVVENLDKYQETHSNVISSISKFLDPINGNQSGKGFEIGEIPNEKDILNCISFISGINKIENINIFAKIIDDFGNKKDILLSEKEMLRFAVPVSKDIDVEICV